MQMQWKHQICPPSLSHGVALSLPEETLRAVQDSLQVHEALRSSHAKLGTLECVLQASVVTCLTWIDDVVKMESGNICMAWMGALVHANDLEGTVLAWRWGLGYTQ